jgi:uncharacterized protein
MVAAINVAIRKIMNGPPYDASHNYQHARRVVDNGIKTLKPESEAHQWARDIDPLVVILGCLVHDIGNRKYRDTNETHDQEHVLLEFLAGFECPDALWWTAALLSASVLFTLEREDPELVADIARDHPAFRIIQDADRLDELGAIGITQMNMYYCARGMYRNGSIDQHLELIEVHFSHYPGLMKTEAGRKEAEEGYGWMVDVWKKQFLGETEFSNV